MCSQMSLSSDLPPSSSLNLCEPEVHSPLWSRNRNPGHSCWEDQGLAAQCLPHGRCRIGVTLSSAPSPFMAWFSSLFSKLLMDGTPLRNKPGAGPLLPLVAPKVSLGLGEPTKDRCLPTLQRQPGFPSKFKIYHINCTPGAAMCMPLQPQTPASSPLLSLQLACTFLSLAKEISTQLPVAFSSQGHLQLFHLLTSEKPPPSRGTIRQTVYSHLCLLTFYHSSPEPARLPLPRLGTKVQRNVGTLHASPEPQQHCPGPVHSPPHHMVSLLSLLSYCELFRGRSYALSILCSWNLPQIQAATGCRGQWGESVDHISVHIIHK
ncbi:hypothetical protein H1C71_011514 [Ictidomys tridecemlineatus]|uniref:uncharacterized protein LOC110597739 n=1 Tax=Ictidomys tridecemlineatus TaxID=43179 RepID=UPI000B53C02C|nr:uncharacterized protein LOC110597739 [Ictidomys tridecemlineatus]KAG3287944.1 hypothetical protein H1C71_011514 [Ictidomys tridecemlineatus]